MEKGHHNIHRVTDWGVTATPTQIRANHPVLAVVYLPLTREAYMAVRISIGAAAFLNTRPI